MSDNVFLFGAGASFDAGIPLLGNFMERMSEMGLTGRIGTKKLSEKDQETLAKAIKIRNRLESYHARVAVNQFNIEQVMSILSFDAYVGQRGARKLLEDFTQAIATTIELSCDVLHDGRFGFLQTQGNIVYRRFWSILLRLYENRMLEIPGLLSFNYDLVLERALFQTIIGKSDGHWSKPFPFTGMQIDYQNPAIPKTWFKSRRGRWRDDGEYREVEGLTVDQVTEANEPVPENAVRIPFFKLHGSLNFPSTKIDSTWNPVLVQAEPKIIPPIFNKTESTFSTPIWKAAMGALRKCKNLIICGYSLPETDTYMQYFLKAALGPNRELNRIFVFDPELFKSGESGARLKGRYLSCFSTQMQDHIIFTPSHPPKPETLSGSFAHMVSLLLSAPEQLLFGLYPAKSEDGVTMNQKRQTRRR